MYCVREEVNSGSSGSKRGDGGSQDEKQVSFLLACEVVKHLYGECTYCGHVFHLS